MKQMCTMWITRILLTAFFLLALFHRNNTFSNSGSCIPATPFAVYHGLSFLTCILKCRCLHGCRSMLYTNLGQMCTLYSNNTTERSETYFGNVLHTVEEYVCVLEEMRCLGIDVCPMTTLAGNSLIFGVAKSDVEERKGVCKTTFHVVDSSNTNCDSYNQRSSPNEACSQFCDTPTLAENMKFTNVLLASVTGKLFRTEWDGTSGVMFERTIIGVECEHGNLLIGSPNITCDGGQWMPRVPTCRTSTIRQRCTTSLTV